jgi:hypothetical protein
VSCPRPKVNYSGTLPGTEKTPLDLSIAKAQIGPWVFEVKYFKYTLFVRILLTHRTPPHSINLTLEEDTQITEQEVQGRFFSGFFEILRVPGGRTLSAPT